MRHREASAIGRGIYFLHFPRGGAVPCPPVLRRKAPGCGQEAETGVRGNPRTELLLGSPGDRQAGCRKQSGIGSFR